MDKFPEWLKFDIPNAAAIGKAAFLLDSAGATVCRYAHCPNIYRCVSRGHWAFMILGTRCTRNCSFCAGDKGAGMPLDPGEPDRVVRSLRASGARYAVVTSVTRDDLPMGGAEQFADVISAVRGYDQGIQVEVLVPDFQGSTEALRAVILARPAVFGHNIETVERLHHVLRPMASYRRSLDLLAEAKKMSQGVITKSSIMVGMGEYPYEVFRTLDDLSRAGVDIVTIGQYLAPSPGHYPVFEYVPPRRFEEYRSAALGKGFLAVASGPLVRSSFEAEDLYRSVVGYADKNEG